jgi:cytochrome c-type biogenesis protein CcmF
MTSLLGTVLLVGTLACALGATVVAATGRTRSALLLMLGGMGGVLAATLLLAGALLAPDFSVAHVADHGARWLTVRDRVTTLWAGPDGSLLLWVTLMAGVTAVATAQGLRATRASCPHPARAAAVLAGVTAFFAAVLLIVANPFAGVSPVPLDGPGPNPLLQGHPAMSLHPPLLYLGFASAAPPFALALVAPGGRRWLPQALPWVRASCVLLTAAIVLGAWWSWSVLGWGGYWAWDPVENLALLPWLTSVALLHEAAAGRRPAGVLSSALAVGGFILVLTAITLTRSGAVLSVHSFAESPQGLPLLALLVAALLTAAVVAARHRGGPPTPAVTGRRRALVLTAVVLATYAGTVLLGTVYPLALEAVTGHRAQVGAPYFDRVAVPTALVVLALLVVGPLLGSHTRDGLKPVARRVAPGLVIASLVVVALRVAGSEAPVLLLALGLVTAAAVSTAVAWYHSRRTGRSAGVALAHLGVLVLVAGVAVSAASSSQEEARLVEGESVSLSGVEVTHDGLETASDDATMTTMLRLDAPGGALQPHMTYHRARDFLVSEPVSRTSWRATYQVVLLSADGDSGEVALRLRRDPLLAWVWAGGALMTLGTALAAASRRGPRTPRRPARRTDVPEQVVA